MSVEPYRCILADPPWNEQGGGKCKRGADRHYPLMKTKDIITTLQDLLMGTLDPPCSEGRYIAPKFPVADNAHLWLWVTNNFLPDGLEVMKALGFRYVNNKCWAKMQMNNPLGVLGDARYDNWKPQNPGLGQYQGGQHELLLFGVRGKLPALWKDKESGARRPGSLILAPRGKHSEKPTEAYEHIENVSPGPRLELFARSRRKGWDAWGNEVDPQRTLGEVHTT